MRFLTSHPRVSGSCGVRATDTSIRSGRRCRALVPPRPVRQRAGDPAGADTSWPVAERGRSAQDLGVAAFEQIVPGASEFSASDWVPRERQPRVPRTSRHRLVDRRGNDHGPQPGGVSVRHGRVRVRHTTRVQRGRRIEHPRRWPGTGEARTPDDGMDAIPRALARSFGEAGGTSAWATSSAVTICRRRSTAFRLATASSSTRVEWPWRCQFRHSAGSRSHHPTSQPRRSPGDPRLGRGLFGGKAVRLVRAAMVAWR